MTFRVVVGTKTWPVNLPNISLKAAAACIEFIFGPLAANPERVGTPLRKPFEGQWRVAAANTECAIASSSPMRSSTYSTSTIAGTPTGADKAPADHEGKNHRGERPVAESEHIGPTTVRRVPTDNVRRQDRVRTVVGPMCSLSATGRSPRWFLPS